MIDSEFVVKEILANKNMAQIAKELGCTMGYISRLWNKAKNNNPELRDFNVFLNRKRIRFSKEFLYTEHIINKKTVDKICKENNCTHSTVERALKEYQIERQYYHSQQGKTKSKHPMWRGCGDIPGWYWNRIQKRAKLDNIEFSISFEYIWNLFQEQKSICALSGVQLVFSTNTKLITASLDRIDSNLGYIEGNLQWIHKDLQWMKRSMSDSKFIDWCKKVSEYNGDENASSVILEYIKNE